MKLIEYIPDPFVNALAWSILHSIWQILAIALLWRVSMIFAKKAPAFTRQNLSIFALFSIPVIFLITFFRQYNLYSKVQKVAFLEFENTLQEPLQSIGNLYLLPVENTVLSRFIEQFAPYIFWLYWAGIAIFSIYFLFSYQKLRNLRKKQISPVPSSWQSIIESSGYTAGISNKIKVYLSANISVPIVTGFFKPMVLFPLAVSASLSMQEVEEILLHEFYHIRCNDYYINTIQNILEILFFYHPCTWWISKSLRMEREAKVDEWVVSQTHNPLNYAQTLINLEQKRQMHVKPVLAATASQSSLFTRIKNIMHMKTRTLKPGQKIAAIVVITFASISLAWLSPPSFMTFYAENTSNLSVQQLQQEPAPQTPQLNQPPASQTPASEPKRIVLENGNSVSWQELSEEDKAEIRKAMQEARVAIREAMEEVNRELNSEEFKAEMRNAREEIQRAREEVNRELNSEEFRNEMRNAREEIRKAMEEVDRELNSEEFREEMRQAREEVRKAMKEVNYQLNSEEFRSEMQKVSEEMQITFRELETINWAELGNNLGVVMEEVGKSMEIVGPILNEVLQGLFSEENTLYEETEEEPVQ